MKKCQEHADGKTCFSVLASARCHKEECSLFKRVKRLIPIFHKYHKMRSRGVIMTTVWDFSKPYPTEKQKNSSKKWLEETYPKLISFKGT